MIFWVRSQEKQTYRETRSVALMSRKVIHSWKFTIQWHRMSSQHLMEKLSVSVLCVLISTDRNEAAAGIV